MLEIFDNPAVASIVLMCILCLLKLNIFMVLIISTLVAGFMAGMTVNDTMSAFMGDMVGNTETAISCALLGAIAVNIARTGLMSILPDWVQKVFEGKKILFLLVIAGISSLSGTIIPIDITFMPISIPSLIHMINRTRVDRRATVCALCWGNRAPYLFIPAGYGLIFHDSISTNITKYGMSMNTMNVWKTMTLPVGVGMALELLFAMLVLCKKFRDYEDIEIASVACSEEREGEITLNRKHIGTIIAAPSTLVVQLIFGPLVIDGMVGLPTMTLSDCFKYSELDDVINSGIGMIGRISFIMPAASGSSKVIVTSQNVDKLVLASTGVLFASRIVSSVVLTLVGFIIVMGAGICFGTVPILAAIYIPMCPTLGYSALNAAYLIGVAASASDVCSPASDGALGSTSGLNPDRQHNHIWDSTMPAVLVFSLPLFAIGVTTFMVL